MINSKAIYTPSALKLTMETEIKPIMDELKIIRKEIEDIREAMPDKDMFLTAEETKLLKESYENEKEGKLVSARALRKDLGI
jgi:Skp family chaperone for outer membrane proteins